MSIIIEFGILEASSASNSKTWLAFELLPGPFPLQWASTFAYEFCRKSLWHFNFGALFVAEPYYRSKISARVKQLSQSVGQTLNFAVKESDITPFIKRKILETLLSDCATIQSKYQRQESPSKVAAQLSDLVRTYIQIYDPEYHFHISLQAYAPQTYHFPEAANALFTCDRHDGWLYLDYIGDGQDSLAAYNEKSTTEHQPQNLFSANSQILYRDNFDGQDLQAKVRDWLKSENQPSDRVGLIPLAKPVHSYSRNQVRELFLKSDTTLEIKVTRDGQAMILDELYESLQPVHSQTVAHYSGGALHAATLWFLRRTYLCYLVNFYVDCHHRYGGSLWMIKQPYYWLRPRAFQFYFATSRPLRKVFYFLEFQFKKRIIGMEK